MFEETRPAREVYVMEEGMVHGGWQYSSIASGDLRSSLALTPHPARPGLPLNSSQYLVDSYACQNDSGQTRCIKIEYFTGPQPINQIAEAHGILASSISSPKQPQQPCSSM